MKLIANRMMVSAYLAAMSEARRRCGTISFQVFQPYSPAKTTATKAEMR